MPIHSKPSTRCLQEKRPHQPSWRSVRHDCSQTQAVTVKKNEISSSKYPKVDSALKYCAKSTLVVLISSYSSLVVLLNNCNVIRTGQKQFPEVLKRVNIKLFNKRRNSGRRSVPLAI